MKAGLPFPHLNRIRRCMWWFSSPVLYYMLHCLHGGSNLAGIWNGFSLIRGRFNLYWSEADLAIITSLSTVRSVSSKSLSRIRGLSTFSTNSSWILSLLWKYTQNSEMTDWQNVYWQQLEQQGIRWVNATRIYSMSWRGMWWQSCLTGSGDHGWVEWMEEHTPVRLAGSSRGPETREDEDEEDTLEKSQEVSTGTSLVISTRTRIC